MLQLIKPIEKEIDGKIYVISKFPAVEGREIMAKYPTSAIPKIGDYSVNEETMFKLMKYVAIKLRNGNLNLSNRELVNNHVESWETLMKIEAAMMEYNCSFFQNGRLSNFLEDAVQKAQAWISKTLTDSLAPSSRAEKQP